MLDDQKIAQVTQLMASDKWAVLQDIRCSGAEVHIHMTVQPELEHFEGHFPGQPVLAGVVQTHWACELGIQIFDIPGAFCGIQNLKFLAVIQPLRNLVLALTFDRAKGALKFSYYCDELRFSEGRILFTAPAG